ncbi:putative pentatricopeptide repeat-containing protein At1g12700, mitochondrial [Daucus carota subsp. sativus]|uniref:putative pentatricopeptide repeat-containing protein At1g12700, mitochondrial n=1 Tax=Daucus carota subsp. sativus TaxID=79200 RepID=UPI0007EF0CC9|nr:PREDICTED: putative pentatricopeptide repeat-containing protein At1g12700, mitochondrial [Daucus carota subsp. sativus]
MINLRPSSLRLASSLLHSLPNPNPLHSHHLDTRQLRSTCSDSQKHAHALNLFDQMLQTQPLPSIKDFTKFLNILVNSRQYYTVVSLFTDMCFLSFPVDLCTYNTVINCCCHVGRFDYAFSLLSGVIKRGFGPDVVTYTTLVRGLIRGDMGVEAEGLVRKLVRWNEVEFDVVMYSTIVYGLCREGEVYAAIECLRFMEKENCEANAITYNTIIDGLCKRGLVDGALDLFSEMKKKGVGVTVVTYTSLIHGLFKSGQWEDAILLFDSMDVSPDVYTYSVLVNGYGKRKMVEEARNIVLRMIKMDEYPNIVTYTTLMQAYCLQGNMDQALTVLICMMNSMIIPNCWSYNVLMDGYCKKLEVHNALNLLRNMAREGLEPTNESYSILLHGLCQMGTRDRK